LERKTANELGEGAEVDLFKDLKEEFEGTSRPSALAVLRLSTVPYLVGPRTGRSVLSYDFSIVEQQSDASY
jgi:hypothetical protein